MAWEDEQKFEKEWHGNCINSYWEETKQQIYAKRMGLVANFVNGKFPVYDLQDKSIIDIGGGPYSLLLKCINVKVAGLIDPCPYPDWVYQRYREAGVSYIIAKAEDLLKGRDQQVVDEVWIYNVLQHTEDPELIIYNARKVSKIIRIFEWIDMPATEGHPHELKESKLNKWLHGYGKTEDINESGCNGRCYYGIFTGKHYGR